MLTSLLALLIASSDFSEAFQVQHSSLLKLPYYGSASPPFRLHAEGKDETEKSTKMDDLMSEVEDALNLADEAIKVVPPQESPPKVVVVAPPLLTAKEKEEALGAGVSGALLGAIVANIAFNEVPELSVAVDPLLWTVATATLVGGTSYGVSSSISMPGTITRSILGKPSRAVGSAVTGAISKFVNNSISKVRAIPGNIVSAIKKQAERTKNDIQSIPGRIEQNVKSTVENTKAAVVNKATTTANEIKNIPNLMMETAIEVAEGTKEAAKKKAEATIEDIKKIPSAVREAAVEAADEAIEELKQTPFKLADASKKAVKETVEGTKQKFVSTVESVVPGDLLKERTAEEPKPPGLPPPIPQLDNEKDSFPMSDSSGARTMERTKENPKVSIPKVDIRKIKIPSLEIPKVTIPKVPMPETGAENQKPKKPSQQQEISELIQAVKSVAAQESAKKLAAKPSVEKEVKRQAPDVNASRKQKEELKKQADAAAEQERRRAEERKRQEADRQRKEAELAKEAERQKQAAMAQERRRAEYLKQQNAIAKKKQKEMEKAKEAERQRQVSAAAAQERRQAEEMKRQEAAAQAKRLQEQSRKLQKEEKRRKQLKQQDSEKSLQESTSSMAKVIKTSPSMRVSSPALKKAPRGVPTIVKWRKRRDGGISGLIYSSANFDDGDRVETSKITGGLVENGNVVTTESGSRYFLGEEIPSKDSVEPLKQLLNAIPGATITLTRKAKENVSLDTQPKPRPLSTFSLFGAGSGAPRELLDRNVASPSNQKAPRGVPTIKRWKTNRDGSVSGYIYGSTSFQDGEKVTTSVIAAGSLTPGEIVRTGSGSRYFLE
jgi:hypothetical protein